MHARVVTRWMPAFVFAAALVFSSAALPAPCTGLVDVDATDAFCPNVEWLKNRKVTLGCTQAGTTFCPNDPVIRLSMAAFLHRLGNALTAVQLIASTGGVGMVDLDATLTPLNCRATSGTGYLVESPRYAHGVAHFVAGPGTGSADIAVQIVESTDGGATWNAASPIHVASMVDGGATSLPVSMMLTPRVLQVGAEVSYTLRISRASGSTTTGDLLQFRCDLRIALENHNPASSPFDADD